MGEFKLKKTSFDGVYIIDCFSVGDNRGRFSKCFEKNIYENAGIPFSINETFASVSSKNVIRGMHFQLKNPQSKLVTVLHGKIKDIIVDLRPFSQTYKKWDIFDLNQDNHRALYIPKGFAHGFISLEDDTIMLYQCEGAYDAATDTGIRFDDPDLAIDWPIENMDLAIYSKRDLELMSFREYEKNPMSL